MVQFKPREYRDFFGKLAKSRVLTNQQTEQAARKLTLEVHVRGMVWALNRHFEVMPALLTRFQPELAGLQPDFAVFEREVPLLAFETMTGDLTPEAQLAHAAKYLNQGNLSEVFLFFPAKPEHERFEGFRTVDGEVRRIGMWMKRWHSQLLNLDFASPDGWLRLYDARTSTQLMTPMEVMQVRFDEERGPGAGARGQGSTPTVKEGVEKGN